MMYQFKDEKLKFEIKNNLNKMLTNNKMLANNKVKDIESITY